MHFLLLSVSAAKNLGHHIQNKHKTLKGRENKDWLLETIRTKE